MSAQHTPGPWEIAEAGSWKDGKRTSTEYFVRRPGDDVAIASEIIDPANNDEPSEANARLIAAAPDLLAELERSIDVIQALHGDVAWDTFHNNAPEMKRIRAAIAKAKGAA
jgi:hypothetical protein